MLESQFDAIYERIVAAAKRSGRTLKDISVVAVIKKQPADAAQKYINFCQERLLSCELGENYLQEWKEKKGVLQGTFVSHAIGHIQSNKIKEAVTLFDEIETIDSIKTIHELQKHLTDRNTPKTVWIQVNISEDDQKFGFPVKEVTEAVRIIRTCQAMKLKGLMTITKAYDESEGARRDFRALKHLAESLEKEFQFSSSLALSMGMSDDFEIAIEEGATHVRIGSALFGAR